jgi:hypothetical protein
MGANLIQNAAIAHERRRVDILDLKRHAENNLWSGHRRGRNINAIVFDWPAGNTG